MHVAATTLLPCNPGQITKTFEQNLLLVQQAFEEKMQTFITQGNAMCESQLLHPLHLASPTKPFILQQFDHHQLES